MYTYMYLCLKQLREAKTHEAIVEGHKHICFPQRKTAQAVSDGTGEERKDTHFAITDKYSLFQDHSIVLIRPASHISL